MPPRSTARCLALLCCLLLAEAAGAQVFRAFAYGRQFISLGDTLPQSAALYIDVDAQGCTDSLVAVYNRLRTGMTIRQDGRLYAAQGGLNVLDGSYSPSENGLIQLGVNTFFTIGGIAFVHRFVTEEDSTNHAMAVGPDSLIYMAGKGLWQYVPPLAPPLPGSGSYLGDFPPALQTARAMTLREGQLYMVSSQNELARVDRASPGQSEVVYRFPDSVGQIESMATLPHACDSVITYAFEHIGGIFGPTVLHELDFETFALSPICTVDYYILGSALPQESIVPPCELYVDLDLSDSTLPGLDYAPPPSCRGPIPVAAADLQVYGQIRVDSVRLRILGVQDIGEEYLEGVFPGPVTATGNGTAALTLHGNGADAEEMEAALRAVAYYNSAAQPAYGLREVEVQAFALYYPGSLSYARIELSEDFLELAVQASPACFGQADGALSVAVQGGEAPYTYTWEDGALGPSREGLPAGAYALTVADARGCARLDTLLLPENDSLWAGIAAVRDTVCGPSGELAALPGGGLPPYAYFWQGEMGDSLLSGVPAGSFGLEVRDSLGCSAMAAYELLGADSVFTAATLRGCAGSPLLYEGTTYLADTVLCSMGLTAFGCDSVHCVSLVFEPLFFEQATAAPCAGQPYLWQGQTFTADTSLCYVYSSQHGCDSTYCLELAFVDRSARRSAAACPGEAYRFGGQDLFLPGTYRDTISDGQPCDSIVELELAHYPPPDFSLAQAGSLCQGGTALLQASGNGAFLWGDGSTGPSLEATAPGTYALTFTDANGCTATDSLVVAANTLAFAFSAGHPDCAVPGQGFVQVDSTWGGLPPYRYRLSGGPLQGSARFEGLAAGPYELQVEDAAGCWAAAPLLLPPPDELLLSLPEDRTIRLGESVALSAEVNRPDFRIEWRPAEGLSCADCPAPAAQPERSQVYTALVTDSLGCTVSGEVAVLVDARARVYLPTAFSPNGDGRNDTFTAYADGSVAELLSLDIYDRWGGKVFAREGFAPNSPALGWDGSASGEPAQAATYVYRLRYRLLDGREEVVSGEVLLVR